MKWTCSKCGESKFKKDYIPSTKFIDGKASTWCKACKTAYNTMWTKQRKESDPAYRLAHNKSARTSRMAFYGLLEDEYDDILEYQGGGCAGCDRPPTENRRLDVDHEHQLNEKARLPYERLVKVRGLLCHRCNRLLGIASDNPVTLRRLADYLENPPAHEILIPKIRAIFEHLMATMTTDELIKFEQLKKDAGL